jgi:hypothetical protein
MDAHRDAYLPHRWPSRLLVVLLFWTPRAWAADIDIPAQELFPGTARIGPFHGGPSSASIPTGLDVASDLFQPGDVVFIWRTACVAWQRRTAWAAGSRADPGGALL